MVRARRALTLVLLQVALGASARGDGLSTFRAQMWEQDLLEIPDGAEEGDQLGGAVAAGDFDGDGFEDLAIGVPTEDVPIAGGEVVDAGTVVVLYGSPVGVDLPGAQFWSQETPGVLGVAESSEYFGAALAVGDFNADGHDDLVIGVPSDRVSFLPVGAVAVLYGTPDGLSATGDQLWNRDSPGIPENPIGGDDFGWSLATGDFDGDGRDDLAIGVPGERGPGGEVAWGGVNVLYGSLVGLTADGNDAFAAEDFGGAYESMASFGQALAAGDFDGDGRADLAVGAPRDDFLGVDDTGSVRVLFGSPAGLTVSGDVYLLGPEADAFQGSALAACDVDGDGDDDLAIGIPGRTVGGDAGAGAVAIRLGDDGQLLDGGEWSQDTAGVQGVAEPGDAFGSALACGDFDLDGRADLVVGVEGEDLQDPNEGAVHVLLGSATGLTATGDQLWLRDDLPLFDPSAGDGDDFFGSAFAVGDFDGAGHADLAIGAPGEALTTAGAAGAVYVLYGFLFADGFESGGTSAWSSVAP